MKTVFLTCGTRGAGKSMYCREIIKRQPDLILISRDEILIELFKKTELSPYEGGHYYAMEIMWKRVKECLRKEGDVKMILDCWNGFTEDRKHIMLLLKLAGANRVVAWRFTTPLIKVIEWFDAKTRNKFNGKEMNESRSRDDYELFNRMAKNIEKEGFDEVFYINPLQKILI